MFKGRKIKNSFLFYFALTSILLYTTTNMALPEYISIFEDSAYHIGPQGGDVAVIENSVEPLRDNIKIDVVSGTDVLPEQAGTYEAKYTVFGIPVKTVSLNVVPDKMLIPCGNISGIVVNTDGVLVIGTGKVKNEDGQEISPSDGILKSGDTVTAINGNKISSKEQFENAVANSEGAVMTFTVLWDGKEQNEKVKPVMSENNGGYKIGCWIRDDTQGLGTLTFIDPENNTFGALGHGIYDVDTNTLMNASEGIITSSKVTGVVKGQKGVPGEVSGTLDKSHVFGEILSNANAGIYGRITDMSICPSADVQPVEIALSKDVHTGKAYVRSDISGKTEDYEIEIESINRLDTSSDRSMTVRITDEKLLNMAGGIIQGFSGSPILQDGKLVGALTHVFVNNPQKGYGIFIDNMLAQSKNIE